MSHFLVTHFLFIYSLYIRNIYLVYVIKISSVLCIHMFYKDECLFRMHKKVYNIKLLSGEESFLSNLLFLRRDSHERS